MTYAKIEDVIVCFGTPRIRMDAHTGAVISAETVIEPLTETYSNRPYFPEDEQEPITIAKLLETKKKLDADLEAIRKAFASPRPEPADFLRWSNSKGLPEFLRLDKIVLRKKPYRSLDAGFRTRSEEWKRSVRERFAMRLGAALLNRND